MCYVMYLLTCTYTELLIADLDSFTFGCNLVLFSDFSNLVINQRC